MNETGERSMTMIHSCDHDYVSEESVHWEEVSYSTISSKVIQRLVIQHYGFAPSTECALYWRGTNDVYLLSNSDGRFALRLSRINWRTRDQLLAELSALRHIRARGLEVATPIGRIDGKLITTIAAPEGARSAILFPWMAGSLPKYASEMHGWQYGRLLANIHAQTDELSSLSAIPKMDLDYLLWRPFALIKPMLTGTPQVLYDLERLAHRIASRFALLEADLRDWGFCHGDAAAYNARIEGDRIALFDFDHCVQGWRLFDLASYRLDARRQGLEAQAWPPFIKGYHQSRPIAEDSLQYIPLLMILRHFWISGQWVAHLSQRGIGSLPENFFEDMVSLCQSIEAEDHSN